MSWLCSCGLKNSGLNVSCAAELTDRDIEHKQICSNTLDYFQFIVASGASNMTPNEELFAKFYNHEKILVKDMDIAQLREHREELSKIAFEAKARVVSNDDELRERQAKTSNKQWLVTDDTSQVATDAINAVKVRKARMSQMDKMREQLLKAGIDEDTVKTMIGNLEKKATEKNLKTITFNKPSAELSAVTVVVAKPTNGDNKEPFNPAALTFGGK